MKIALVHNYYQVAGGEGVVVSNEKKLLESKDNQVVEFTKSNHEIYNLGVNGKIRLAAKTIYNWEVKREFEAFVKREEPDIVHFHNTFPLISPSVYGVCNKHNIPAIQTLHNYRLLCPSSVLYREGRICEDCLGKKIPLNSVINSCYRGSATQTGVVAAMLGVHNLLGTWRNQIDVFIALTKFAKQKMVQGGFPERKIIVKPNFTDEPAGWSSESGSYALFVGRLSQEKGIVNLINSWKYLGANIPLRIVGDGPLSGFVKESSKKLKGVEWFGRKSRKDILRLMKNACFLVFPSEWYEGGFPLVVIESFSSGLPVISSKVGGMTSLIKHGQTGLHFSAGSMTDLIRQVKWAIENPKTMKHMRSKVRIEYEMYYSSETSYKSLMGIYKTAIETLNR